MLKAQSKLFYAGSAAAFVAISTTIYTTQQSKIIQNETLDKTDSTPEDLLPKKKKSKVPVLPPSVYDTDYPGVYAWGNNSGNVIAPGYSTTVPSVRSPYRIPFFDGRVLRDLALTGSLGVAVLDNGDVVQWGDAYSKDQSAIASAKLEKTVKGRDIKKVQVADGKAIYGLNKSGSRVYAWPVSRDELVNGERLDTSTYNGGSWWKIWTWGRGSATGPNLTDDAAKLGSCLTVKLPSLGYTEYIKDISVGNDHILVLTSKGRVFSGATGVYSSQKPKESKGQYGIASLSQFDEAPVPGKVFEIKSFKETIIDQIATGDYHSLARSREGKVYGFGENMLGQLGIPYSYSTANSAVPTLLPFHKLYPRRIIPEVTDIAAGGSTSYVTIQPKPNPSELLDRTKQDKDEFNRDIYAFGGGLVGQLGTGAYVHAQSTPVKIRHFANLSEYSEKLRQMVQIDLSQWSVGRTHTAVTVGGAARTAAGFGHDVLIWGGNEHAQIGTGKRNNVSKPISIAGLPVDRVNPAIAVAKAATTADEIVRDEDAWHLADQTSANELLRLFHRKYVKYVDPDTNSKRSGTLSQVLLAGDNNTAVFYKRS
ncbi:hypothetical protein D0Z03_001722 [Geotrichum reessii]|nr:hypothetical protein D0Z03_001722 [Galactomyces reessii]